MANKVLCCPACGAKLGWLRLLNERFFGCPRCKKTIEIRINNNLALDKVSRVFTWLTRLMWGLITICIFGVFMDIRSTDLALPYFMAEWLLLFIILGFIWYLLQTKKALYKDKMLKLVVKK
jgi:uncharacterized paraquat-inducible protein A